MLITRRQFLTHGAAAGLYGAVGCRLVLAVTHDPAELTASQALSAFQKGELSAENYAKALLARAQACGNLNAFINQSDEALLAAAREADRARAAGQSPAPLTGIPLALKDNIDTVLLPTSGGTPALKANTPPRNAPIAQTLFDAGALLAGKTNMHELAFGITNNNVAFGPARNPYNPDTIPGGSSGGTAVAVAARLAPAGLGTDTGGSCRIPAALCGVVGFRPTIGRYSATGVIPISSTRDTPGPLARSVEDVALLDGVITGAPLNIDGADLSGVRFGVPREYFYDDHDPQVANAMAEALTVLKELDAELVEVSVPELAELNNAVGFPVALYEIMRELPRYLAASAPDVTLENLLGEVAGPDVAGVLKSQLGDDKVPEAVYREAVGPNRAALQEAYRRYFLDHRLAAMVFLTTPLPARPIGQEQTVRLNDKDVPTFLTYIRNTDPSSNAGLPGLSLPIALSENGLPIGLELDGRFGADRLLLRLGLTLERAFGPLPAPPACT